MSIYTIKRDPQRRLGGINHKWRCCKNGRGAIPNLKNPTFDQYPTFAWAPLIQIMDNMTEYENEESNEENSERKLIEDIAEEVI